MPPDEVKGPIRNMWLAVLMSCIAGAMSWGVVLMQPTPHYSLITIAVVVVCGIAIPSGYVGWALHNASHHTWQPPSLIAALVTAQAICAEGAFAEIYRYMSACDPHAFEPPLSGVDAIYFTISTATTTGMGDIHPVSAAARLTVSAQMVVSVFLIVIAIGTAAQRFFAHRD